MFFQFYQIIEKLIKTNDITAFPKQLAKMNLNQVIHDLEDREHIYNILTNFQSDLGTLFEDITKIRDNYIASLLIYLKFFYFPEQFIVSALDLHRYFPKYYSKLLSKPQIHHRDELLSNPDQSKKGV